MIAQVTYACFVSLRRYLCAPAAAAAASTEAANTKLVRQINYKHRPAANTELNFRCHLSAHSRWGRRTNWILIAHAGPPPRRDQVLSRRHSMRCDFRADQIFPIAAIRRAGRPAWAIGAFAQSARHFRRLANAPIPARSSAAKQWPGSQ